MTFGCQFCKRSFKTENGLSQHIVQCKDNPQRTVFRISHRKGKTGFPGWCKGLNKFTDERIMKIANSVSASTKGKPGRVWTETDRENRRTLLKKIGHNGGHKAGSGRGKKGWYKGFRCDSSYELAYVVYCLDHRIPIARCKEVRYYEFEGIRRKYYPDFIVNDQIVEIKGYKTKQWEAKLADNPDVLVYYEKDLMFVFDYVVLTYGKKFIDLYENREE